LKNDQFSEKDDLEVKSLDLGGDLEELD